jgi:hypothetical protein
MKGGDYMISTKTRDQVNGFLARGYSEIRRLIHDGHYEKAKSLAYAFSLVASHGEDGVHYDWDNNLGYLNTHYEAHPIFGIDENFLQMFDGLRQRSEV